MKQFALLIYLFTNVSKEAMLSSIDVCLSSSVDSNQMTFVCKTDDLHLPVYFYDNHNKEIAHCTIPHPFPECTTAEREDALVTVAQFPEKNETILFIEESTDHRSNGYWSCEHGKNLYHANVEINIKKAKVDGHENDETSNIVGWTLVLIVAVSISVLTCIFPDTPGKMYNWVRCISKNEQDDTGGLIPLSYIPINAGKYPVRVCGIGYLAEDTVVVIDGNNRTIIVFKSGEASYEELTRQYGEPNAMTTMNQGHFAITYPFKNYIKIYKYVEIFTNSRSEKTKSISEVYTIRTDGKPFSIAFHGEKLAVEDKPSSIPFHGEKLAVEDKNDEHGSIIIYDIATKNPEKTITYNKFVSCTRSTIRLALSQNCVFVADEDDNTVTCFSFDKKKNWTQDIHAPKAIIVFEYNYSDKKVLVSSEKSKAIFKFKALTGSKENLGFKVELNCPRYMAYHSETKKLCFLAQNVNYDDELFYLKLS